MAVISAPISSPASMGRGGWRDLDWGLLALVVLLSLWGIFTVASATKPREDAPNRAPASSISATARGAAPTASSRLPDVVKQAVWVGVGLTLLLLLALGDYQLLIHLQGWIYALNILALTALLMLPRSIAPIINGAKSWIALGPVSLQPSEFSKFAVILTLAAFLSRRQERMRSFSTVLWSLLFLAPPLLLILKQPDFGTMLAVLSIWFGMLFFGGARLWHLGVVLLVGVTLFGAAWHFNKLKPHQKERLAVFLDSNPSSRSAKTDAYQITQSQIAIGSGQISGQGWGKGMQNRAGYVPENTTDFIFAVVGEELGFVGGSILILAYLLLLLRAASLATSADTYFGVLIAGGFTFLIAFHSLVNLGMTMRVMPITGVPLPFFSYGGSSYLAFALCAGLLESIAVRSRRNIIV